VDHRGLDLGQTILADSPEHGAQILATYEENLSLSYLTKIWGIRPDLKIISDFEALSSSVRPWYVTKSAVQALPVSQLRGYHLSTAGSTLISVATVASIGIPKSAHTVLEDFGDQLRLEAYTIQLTSSGSFQKGKAGLVNPGISMLQVSLFWRALARMEVDYAVSVRPAKGRELLRPAGRLIQEDNRHPVWGNYPTSRWEKGEVVRDDYVLPLPGGLSFDALMILVYYDADGSLRELDTAWISLDREFETR